MSDTYFETLSGALNGAVHSALARVAVLDCPAFLKAVDQFPALYASRADLAPGASNHSFSVPILTLKGKPTKKFFHVSVYRMDSGKYELTTYVL